jgi:hypothetical protein
MPQDPLLTQLAERCRTFSAGTGISLNKMARLIGIEPANFSAFVNGRIELSSRSTIKLLQLLSLSKSQVEAKLGVKNVQIAHYQQNGVQMQLDSGGSWVPGLIGGDQDPNGSTDIGSTNKNPARSVPDAAELEFLAGLAGLHQKIVDKINNWQAQKKARPNPNGSTEPARKISDNTTSRTPGPRGDLFSVDPAEHLAWLQKERKRAEEALALEKAIKKERELAFNARVELLKFKDGKS